MLTVYNDLGFEYKDKEISTLSNVSSITPFFDNSTSNVVSPTPSLDTSTPNVASLTPFSAPDDGTSLLCSIYHKNNFQFSSKTTSETPQILCQKYLSNGDLENTFKVIQDYNDRANHTNYVIGRENLDTNKLDYIIAHKTTRFSLRYIRKIKRRLIPLTALKHIDIGHFVLTIRNPKRSNYIKAYRKLKRDFTKFIKKLRSKYPEIPFIDTFETTEDKKDLSYHPHLHLITLGIKRIPNDFFHELKQFWFKKANSGYIHYNFIPKGRNTNAFRYVLKYVTKETSTINLTSAILFSVKGRAYTMSKSLSDKLKEAQETSTIEINNIRYRYFFFAKITEPFRIFEILGPEDFDPTSLAQFLMMLTEEEQLKAYELYEMRLKNNSENMKKPAKEQRKRFLDSITYRIN